MALDVGRVGLPDGSAEHDRPGVVLRLQQTRHVVRLVGPDEGGGTLQTHVHAEPAGQNVVKALPPAGLIGLLGELDETPGLVVSDPVGVQQQLDIRDLQRDLGGFHPADGACGHAKDLCRFLAPESGPLPQILQALAENDLAHRGGGPRFTHFETSPRAVACSVPRSRKDEYAHSEFFKVGLAKLTIAAGEWSGEP